MLTNNKCPSDIDKVAKLIGDQDRISKILKSKFTNQQKGYLLIKVAINLHVTQHSHATDKMYGVYGFINGKNRLLRKVNKVGTANRSVKELKRFIKVPYEVKELN